MNALRWIVCLVVSGALWAQPSEMAKYSSRADVWPKEVTIKAAQPASKSQPAIPAGAKAKVVGLEGSLVGVEYGGAFSMIPVGQTDFIEKAATALAERPNPPAKAAPAPAPAAAAPPPRRGPTHRLADLENELMYGDGAKIPRGKIVLASRDFILLQFGGGNRWNAALVELSKVLRAAYQREANFETLLVPIPGMTVQQAGALMTENGGAWPSVDASNQRLLTALWNSYGHAGSFALALVDAQGRTVAATRPGQGRIEDFESVLNAVNQLPGTKR